MICRFLSQLTFLSRQLRITRTCRIAHRARHARFTHCARSQHCERCAPCRDVAIAGINKRYVPGRRSRALPGYSRRQSVVSRASTLRDGCLGWLCSGDCQGRGRGCACRGSVRTCEHRFVAMAASARKELQCSRSVLRELRVSERVCHIAVGHGRIAEVHLPGRYSSGARHDSSRRRDQASCSDR